MARQLRVTVSPAVTGPTVLPVTSVLRCLMVTSEGGEMMARVTIEFLVCEDLKSTLHL